MKSLKFGGTGTVTDANGPGGVDSPPSLGVVAVEVVVAAGVVAAVDVAEVVVVVGSAAVVRVNVIEQAAINAAQAVQPIRRARGIPRRTLMDLNLVF